MNLLKPYIEYENITVIIPGRPVPAVRTTQRKKWVCPYYKRYQEYKNRIKVRIFGEAWEKFGHLPSLGCDIYVSCEVYLKSGKFGDVDNYLKSCLDGIQLSQLIKNDKQVVRAEVERFEVDTKEEERMEIRIKWLEV